MLKVEKNIDHVKLAKAIEATLSRPPSKAGRRLQSERDLAEILKVDRGCVREALTKLVSTGILVRRQGSGTFVRSVPPMMTVDDEADKLALQVFGKSECLFAQNGHLVDDVTVTNRKIPAKQLHLEAWCVIPGVSWQSSGSLVISGLFKGAAFTEQRLTLHSIIKEDNRATAHSVTDEEARPISVDELRRQLRNSSADGYIVTERYADHFVEALDGRQVPVVFYWPADRTIRHDPTIQLDSTASINRAVEIFAAQGYHRIGIIGMEQLSCAAERRGTLYPYQRAMEDLDLTYRACETSPANIMGAMEATQRLLKRDDPPQAIYVADDFLLIGVMQAFEVMGVVPGRDIAVITLSNRGLGLPGKVKWSCLEFDPEYFGSLLVNNLCQVIQTAGNKLVSQRICATWRPGETHFLGQK